MTMANDGNNLLARNLDFGNWMLFVMLEHILVLLIRGSKEKI